MKAYPISLEGDELNKKLGGGLPQGGIILIEAPNGLGKSILSQRFTYGLLQNKVTVSYFSTELPVAGFISQMDSVGYSIKQDFLDKKLKFVSIFSNMVPVNSFNNLIKDVLKHEEFMDSDVVVIDAISDFLVNRDLDKEESFKLLRLFKEKTMQKKTLIVTVDPENVNEHIHTLLKSTSTVYLEMRTEEQFGNKMNLLNVKRFNAAQGTLENNLSFKVRPGVGIVVELASGS